MCRGALGVGQDTISRLEKRSDMLLSTMRRYVEAMGGSLELVAQFPNRPPVVIDHLVTTHDHRRSKTATATTSLQLPGQAGQGLPKFSDGGDRRPEIAPGQWLPQGG